jgi:hypothetical protein
LAGLHVKHVAPHPTGVTCQTRLLCTHPRSVGTSGFHILYAGNRVIGCFDGQIPKKPDERGSCFFVLLHRTKVVGQLGFFGYMLRCFATSDSKIIIIIILERIEIRIIKAKIISFIAKIRTFLVELI